MPETVFTPQDQTRPLPAFGTPAPSRDGGGGNSFGDLPDEGIQIDDPTPAVAAAPEPDRQAAPPQPSAPPIGAEHIGVAVAQALDQLDRRRQTQAHAEASRQAWDEQMRAQWEPSPLPENFDELLADGAKMRELLASRDAESRRAIASVAEPLINQVRGLEGAMTVMYQTRHRDAFERACEIAEKNGVENPREYYGALDAVMRANPATYWQQAVDPHTMATAIDLISRAGAPRDAPMQPMRSATTTGGQRNAPRAPEAAAATTPEQDRILADVERKMGVRFTPKQRAEYAQTIRGIR